MKKTILLFLAFAMMQVSGCSQSAQKTDRVVGSDCEGCDMMFDGMPQDLSWQTTIAGPDEPGEQMIINGTIFKKDGKTPAPDVILYVYHTDSKGLYSPAPKQTQAKRHGHLHYTGSMNFYLRMILFLLIKKNRTRKSVVVQVLLR